MFTPRVLLYSRDVNRDEKKKRKKNRKSISRYDLHVYDILRF